MRGAGLFVVLSLVVPSLGGSCASNVDANGSDGGDGATTGGNATFTLVYGSILSVSCVGSDCHSPGFQGYVSYATKADAYHSLFPAWVTPGDSAHSDLYMLVSTGMMPLPPNPPLPAAKGALIKSWIDAGALDD